MRTPSWHRLLLALTLFIAPALPTTAQNLPVVRLTAGIHLIQAEVADNEARRRQGLMYREKLASNQGMLFVFENKATHCFWMRNTLIPLSIAFLEDDGTIVNIADMQPQSDDSHCPSAEIRYALEMNQGWFKQRGFKAGMKLGSFTAKQ